MRAFSSRAKPCTAVLAIVLLGVLAVPAVSALHVEGVKILIDVQPGRTYTYPMSVSIDPGEPAADIAVEVLGFGQSADGTYLGLPPAGDTGPYSARPFVSVDAPGIRLEPGGGRSFNATIRVPPDAGAGGRYATIYIHPGATAVSGSGAGIATAVLVPVMLTLQGSPLNETGTITDIRAGEPVEGQPARVLVSLKNTGNHHYYGATVSVTVMDPEGKPVAAGSTRPSVWAVIPGYAMTLEVPLSPAIATGTHPVKAEARINEGGPLLDSKTVTIPIRGAAAAPPVSSPTKSPGPGAALTAGFISAAILLWSVRSRK